MAIPSIDLMKGKIVQLQQGKEKKLQIEEPPLEFAKKFSAFKEVQVIDLDAAMGKGNNIELVKKLCKVVSARVGGGIRSIEKAKEVLGAGAEKVIVGTAATPEFLGKLAKEVGKEKIIVALDSWKGEVVAEGWKKKTGAGLKEKVKELEEFCGEFLFTFVEREGLLKGIDLEKAGKLRALTEKEISVAGGITTLNELKCLEAKGLKGVLGMALYTGKIPLQELLLWEIDFEKGNGLVPAIVQDAENNEVLMLAYMDKEALGKTLREGKACYWSRSRQKHWVKGETSGNFQLVKEILTDCDNDVVLLKVKQKGVACHTGKRSCFYKEVLK